MTARTSGLRQSKTGARVVIPVGAPLKAALDAATEARADHPQLERRRPWTPDGFRASWGKACKKAGIADVTFNDLRGTAVTRLALVGCTEARDRHHHRAQLARRALDPRRALSAPRCRSWRATPSPSSKWATRSGSRKALT